MAVDPNQKGHRWSLVEVAKHTTTQQMLLSPFLFFSALSLYPKHVSAAAQSVEHSVREVQKR